MPKRVHKACSAIDTVARIRQILQSLSILLREDGWNATADQCYSMHLSAIGMPPAHNPGGFSSNGKGLTPEFALASAYGEFMERLQNHYLLLKENDYGLVTENGSFFPDETRIPYSQLVRDQPEVIRNLVDGELPPKVRDEFEREGVLCAPFYNVFDAKTELLPVEWIQKACLSNGMCAGNTPEEALVQGLSEIYERAAIAAVYSSDEPSFPAIPRDVIDALPIGEHVRAIEARTGLVFHFKDVSLCGKYPVVACVGTDEDRSGYHVHFGADPIFENAVERTLTETFQGRSPTAVVSERSVIDLQPTQDSQRESCVKRFAICRTGSVVPSSFLFDIGTPMFSGAFLPEFTSFGKSLRFVVNKLREDGRKLYVRDVSFLGFPTFHIYSPGISEVLPLNRDRPLHSPSESRLLRRVLLRLKSSSPEDTLAAARLIERALEFPYHDPRTLERPFRSGIVLNAQSDFITQFQLDASWGGKLLTMMGLKGADYEMAARNLSRYVASEQSRGEATSYELCFLAYLQYKTSKTDPSEIKKRLSGFFSRSDIERVEQDIAGDPFQYLTLPECGDCGKCPTVQDCAYPEWSNIDTRLRERAQKNPIDQLRLRAVFE